MCGIIGGTSKRNLLSKDIIECGLDVISYRGRDARNVFEKDHFFMGHLLHSIVDFVPQPLVEKNAIFGVNCELYNWKELKNK